MITKAKISKVIHALPACFLVVFVGYLPIAAGSALGFYLRGYDNVLTNDSISSLKAEIIDITDAEYDYVKDKTEECRSSIVNKDTTRSFSRLKAGIFGVSQSELDESVLSLRSFCLKEYLLSSPTFEEMNTRSRSLRHLSPYSSDEMAMIYSDSKNKVNDL